MLRSVVPNQDSTSSTGDGVSVDATLQSVRDELSALSDQVAKLSAYRLKQAQRLAGEGADAARAKVDEYPLTSIALAFGVGAIVGLAVTGSSSRRRPRDWRSMNTWRSASMSDVRDDLADYTEQMRRSLRRSATNSDLAARLEQVAERISSVSPSDAKATFTPVLNRVMGWLGSVKDQASAVADDVAKRVS